MKTNVLGTIYFFISVEKVNNLSHKNKITISELRKNFKTKDQILKENLKKIKLIEKASKVTLDKNTINQVSRNYY